MLTISSPDHALQHGRSELSDGRLRESYECPVRVDRVLDSIRAASLGDVVEPAQAGMQALLRVHDDAYLRFLESAWERWAALGRDCDAIPFTWPARGMRQAEPRHIDGQLAYFAFDVGTPITAGTWRAATASASIALTGASILNGGAEAAFALCRPPGHHAARDLYGGYCFLNNAAIAAQRLLDDGAGRIAILDIDYHHGNGTQSIFYGRGDVLFVSIHAQPEDEYPYFTGFVDERGEGEGEGHNVNYPLPIGTGFDDWSAALRDACTLITDYSPDTLVVSLGVDTFAGDPISRFRLASDDYVRVGERMAGLRLPTLFVMEGGYAIDELGMNVVNVLTGFEGT